MPPGPVTLVPPANTARPRYRNCPGQRLPANVPGEPDTRSLAGRSGGRPGWNRAQDDRPFPWLFDVSPFNSLEGSSRECPPYTQD
jgi:hypothetical protein